MTNTDILALIGALTGSFAASSIIWTYLKEKPSVKINFPFSDLNIFFPCSVEQDYYLHQYRIVLYARIENTSSLPVSIYKFELNNGDRYLFSSSATNAKGIYFVDEISNSKVFSLNLERDQIKLPITIQSYGLVEGFAFFPCNIENYSVAQFPVLFKAHTTRGIFSKMTTIGKYVEIDPSNVKNIPVEI